MRVGYQHANPSRGNESFLLRFHETAPDRTTCVLVDAGDGVDVGELLGEEEYLDAVLLTHAHLDHYERLVANHRHGAPVYASPGTAAMLETVLDEGARNYDIGDADAVLDRLAGIDGWTDVTAEVAVRPVPAGHAPGAAGFLLRFEDGTETQHVLATGDFTHRRAGGYPGFMTDLPVDVGAVFLTGATDDDFERALTESVGTALRRAHDGSAVLLTTGGLAGVQYAYLLGHLGARFDRPVAVRLVGQAAKLYADLGYDVPNVETVPAFDDPETLMDRETVTIAGPEVPRERSSGRLFGVIADDPEATLVQVTSGATTPVESAGCLVDDYALANHPTEDEIDDVVEALYPMQVVITHQRQHASHRYKDKYDSFVWTTDGDGSERTLYDAGEWVAPEWVKGRTVRTIRNHHRMADDRTDDADAAFPALNRADDPDLAAEGLDVDAVRERLHLPDDTHATADDTGGGRGPVTEPANPTEAPTAADGARADEALTTEPGLADVFSRLDAIEAAVSRETIRARVIDAGDGVTLLRLPDDVALEHGHEIEVAIRSVGGGETEAEGGDAAGDPD